MNTLFYPLVCCFIERSHCYRLRWGSRRRQQLCLSPYHYTCGGRQTVQSAASVQHETSTVRLCIGQKRLSRRYRWGWFCALLNHISCVELGMIDAIFGVGWYRQTIVPSDIISTIQEIISGKSRHYLRQSFSSDFVNQLGLVLPWLWVRTYFPNKSQLTKFWCTIYQATFLV